MALLEVVGAVAFLVMAFGIVGPMLYSLALRLRHERGQQPVATRSPLWLVVVAGLGVTVGLAVLADVAGWSSPSVFRLAIGGVVLATAVQGWRRRR